MSDPKPEPPMEPDKDECCGEGCVRCVYDVYEEALARYRVALAAWCARQAGAPRIGGNGFGT
jgi:hypothetical protein